MSGPVDVKFHPYVVYCRIVPDKADGRRFVYIRDMEREADRVERLLISANFNIAYPIAFTPQIGQQPARLTIVGFRASTAKNNPPVNAGSKLVHSGTVDGEKTSVVNTTSGNQGWGDDPTSQNRADVLALKSAIEAAVSGIEVIGVVYQGVRYGIMPSKKGFFSFV
ncbi:MAG: hypothetical protein QXU32_00580 [Nitrososphaerales archaeon]